MQNKSGARTLRNLLNPALVDVQRRAGRQVQLNNLKSQDRLRFGPKNRDGASGAQIVRLAQVASPLLKRASFFFARLNALSAWHKYC